MPDHQVQGLYEASAAARAQLSEERQRVQDHVDAMIKRVELARKEQQTQLDKRTALESIIRKQHGTLVAAAEKFLVEALATLKTESEGNEIELDKEVDARYVVQSLSPELGSVLFCVRSLVEALVTLKTESQGNELEQGARQGGRARARR